MDEELTERLLRALGAWPNGYAAHVTDSLPEVCRIVANECAKVCDDVYGRTHDPFLKIIAAAIRQKFE